ncbi:hypothetical protein CWI37_1369p0010 [Hamiltosporidium tvaerminnensis]|uniref:Arrestin-like N-terminal domain-containing protein n=2 Tax=Hamiltosporidium TaxID=1176354 RepID=A0A4Q9KYR7_9MICR|nr:hypothetical protein CWI37_1369p0010 [Hamiltosporidium tvaerminnensis]
MKKEPHFYISLDKKIYASTDFINGIINLKISEPLDVQRIELRFYKILYSNYTDLESNLEKSKKIKNLDNEIIYEKRINILDRTSEVKKMFSGHHKFPFKMQVSQNDGASNEICQITENINYQIVTKYIFEASLKVFDVYKPILSAKKNLFITEYNDIKQEEITKVEICSCFFIFQKLYFLKTWVDKNIYFSGENIFLRSEINTKKDIKDTINDIEVHLYQCIEANINGKFISHVKFIAKNSENTISSKNSITSKLRIPSIVPSSSYKENNYYVEYFLYIFVKFHRSLPIRIKNKVQISQNRKQELEPQSLPLLDGETYATKFFTVD